MRIAITIERLDTRRGGAEVGAVRLIQDLVRRGHEVHVLTEAVCVELPPNARARLISLPVPGVAWRQLHFAKQVKRALQAEQFDASVACGRAFSEDIVWSQNGTHPGTVEGAVRSYYYNPLLQRARRFQDFYSARSWIYAWLERHCFARNPPPRVIVPSRMVAHEFERFYHLAASNIRVAYYQIDLNRFSISTAQARRADMRKRLGLEDGTLAILFVGQNFKRKGVRPLIEAAAALQKTGSDFSVLIAGGSERQAAPFVALSRQLGCAQRVRFLGATADVPSLYAAADVFCLPSFYDTFGMVALEAMACGVATIASGFCGAAEIISHGENGFVLRDPRNASELAGLFAQLTAAELRHKLGRAGITTAEALCRQNSANEIGLVVEQLASTRSSIPRAF